MKKEEKDEELIPLSVKLKRLRLKEEQKNKRKLLGLMHDSRPASEIAKDVEEDESWQDVWKDTWN